jgi:hypothetical protein
MIASCEKLQGMPLIINVVISSTGWSAFGSTIGCFFATNDSDFVPGSIKSTADPVPGFTESTTYLLLEVVRANVEAGSGAGHRSNADSSTFRVHGEASVGVQV